MQGDNWGVPRGCRFLTLSKVVIQQGPEVVTAATEESLREESSEGTSARIRPQVLAQEGTRGDRRGQAPCGKGSWSRPLGSRYQGSC